MQKPFDFLLWDLIFSEDNENQEPIKDEEVFDEDDWENPDNCSDREYMDDDDYDDFD